MCLFGPVQFISDQSRNEPNQDVPVRLGSNLFWSGPLSSNQIKSSLTKMCRIGSLLYRPFLCTSIQNGANQIKSRCASSLQSVSSRSNPDLDCSNQTEMCPFCSAHFNSIRVVSSRIKSNQDVPFQVGSGLFGSSRDTPYQIKSIPLR